MATRTSKLKTDPQMAVMAIREQIMEYFKGTCVKRVADCPELGLTDIGAYAPGGLYYVRRQRENEAKLLVSLSGTPICTLQRAPETIVLHTTHLDSSKELQAVRKGIETFLKRYLQGTVVKFNDGDVEGSEYLMQRDSVQVRPDNTIAYARMQYTPALDSRFEIGNITLTESIDWEDVPF